MMEESTRQEYYQKVHFWGRLTLSLAIVFFLGIGVYLSFVRGLHPGWEPITAAFLAVAAMVGHTWINVGDQVMYLLLMGPAATYMAQLTGNVKNMRLPSAMAACAMLDDQEDRTKRDILATFGVAASVVVNTAFLVLLVVAGQFVLTLLPPQMLKGLNYIVPALFGAIFGQFALKNLKIAGISMVLVLVVINLPVIPAPLRAITAILLSIAVNLMLHRHREKNAQK